MEFVAVQAMTILIILAGTVYMAYALYLVLKDLFKGD